MPDRWAAWLAERRFGGNEDARRESMKMFDEFRGRVLDGARIEDGDTVLDVGCGEGLIGFGALGLVGDGGQVLFSDVSEDVLNVCREIAAGDRCCAFVRASADDLPLADAAVDVVTTIVMLALAPFARFPRLQVTVPPLGKGFVVADRVQLPWVEATELKWTLSGKGSVAVTPVASCGPVFVTVSV